MSRIADRTPRAQQESPRRGVRVRQAAKVKARHANSSRNPKPTFIKENPTIVSFGNSAGAHKGRTEPTLLHLQTIQHSLVCGSQLTKVSVRGDEDQIKQTALWSCDRNQPVAFAEGLTVLLDWRCSAETD